MRLQGRHSGVFGGSRILSGRWWCMPHPHGERRSIAAGTDQMKFVPQPEDVARLRPAFRVMKAGRAAAAEVKGGLG